MIISGTSVAAKTADRKEGLMFKRGLVFALCLSAFFNLDVKAAQESRSPLAIHAFNQGVQQFNARHYEQAIPFFDQAISHDANFSEAYYARGACRHYLKNSNAALTDINEAIRLNPENISAVALRGVLYYENEQWDAAFADFNYVLGQRPNDGQSLLGRGVIYLRQDEVGKAQRDFRLFLKGNPDDPMAPRLRKLLASLSQEPPESEGETEGRGDGEKGRFSQSPSHSFPPSSRRSPRHASAETHRMAEELFVNTDALSSRFSRKVMRSTERAEIAGDRDEKVISPKPSHSGSPGTSGVQIVEPQ